MPARNAVRGFAHGDTAQGGEPAWHPVGMNSDCVWGRPTRAVLTAHTAFDPRPMEWLRPDPGVHTTRSERPAPME
eukprot:363843-Chlamydomonas_euryale.AAC.2